MNEVGEGGGDGKLGVNEVGGGRVGDGRWV